MEKIYKAFEKNKKSFKKFPKELDKAFNSVYDANQDLDYLYWKSIGELD